MTLYCLWFLFTFVESHCPISDSATGGLVLEQHIDCLLEEGTDGGVGDASNVRGNCEYNKTHLEFSQSFFYNISWSPPTNNNNNDNNNNDNNNNNKNNSNISSNTDPISTKL